MSTPALLFESASRRYRVGWRRHAAALERLDLELARGVRLGLVGPNGAGKSTCLRLAAGIERPSAGRVLLFGLPADTAAARRRTGYAPEGFPFPRELRAANALELLARLAGLSPPERRSAVPRLLDELGLAAVARERLSGFSRGMRRRFALGQAFLGQPDVVLLDEPTAGLDANGFAVLQRLLDGAQARGTTLVVASHVPTLLQSACDELLVLGEGRVRTRGPAAELLGRTADLGALARLYGGEVDG